MMEVLRARGSDEYLGFVSVETGRSIAVSRAFGILRSAF